MLRSGSICISFLYKYLTTKNEIEENDEIISESDNGKKLIKKADKLKCLTETFQSYGGVLAKLSQILCSDEQNNQVFSDCKPFSQKETIEYFKKYYQTDIDFFKNVNSVDFNVFKSGSIGQVHKAIYNKDNELKDIVIKVQYTGLKEQVDSDLFILDTIIKYLYKFSNLSNAMVDIKTKLNEELDYKIELYNQKLIYDLWKEHENINIPEVIPEISNDKILSMYFVDADTLTSFINNSTQEERNKIGKYIVEFIFTSIFKHNIFYSDIHYGNFLIKDNKELYVMDFGCLNFIKDDMLNNLKLIHKSILNDDIDSFYFAIENLGIIDKNISTESKIYSYEYFKFQYIPWISNNFEFTEEWLQKSIYKDVDLMKEWNLPPNMVYLNKIPFGLFHILTKLKLKYDFTEFFKELLE
jgi:predicted unusual protein kinase regulating ubiquinone biosynthesis (AarF/ABC1/UbiB family)